VKCFGVFQRRYTKAGLERLTFIRHSRDLGLSIANIRELVKLSETPEQSCAKANRIASAHLKAVQRRISKLKKLERELKFIANVCDSNQIGECRVMQILADHSLCKAAH
jgi:DNA-binding transcriptional MerR regulator